MISQPNIANVMYFYFFILIGMCQQMICCANSCHQDYSDQQPIHTKRSRAGTRKRRQISVITGHRPPPLPPHPKPPSALININLQLNETERQSAKKHTLKIMNTNCRSLISLNKRVKLEQLLETHQPDIVLATETHLDENISSSSIFNENYLNPPPHRKDRKLGEGGVLVAVKNDIISVDKEEADTDCEITWKKISLQQGEVFVGSFYRQPASGVERMDHLYGSLEKIFKRETTHPNIILGGDFNLPDIKWADLSIRPNPRYAKAISEKMLDIINEFNLTQIVKEPTREINTLDLVFTTNPDLVESVQIVPGMSDHEAVLCNVNLKLKVQNKPPRVVLNYPKGNIDGIKEDLKKKLDIFKTETRGKCTNERWQRFRTTLLESVDKNIPKKVISAKPHLPWITPKIRRLIKKKQRRYNRAKKYGREADWNEFKELRKTIHTELKREHDKYVIDLLDDNEKTTKRFWKYIKAKRKSKSGITVLLKPDGSEATETKEKCDILNAQYQSVFTIEDQNLPNIEDKEIPTMSKIKVTEKGVAKLLHNLDPSKAAGPDFIPTRILKECADEIAPFLCLIYQQSIDEGIVPEDWKHAKITAIFKKGRRDQAANYRPVSLTSVTCKVLEHIIFHSIMEHLDQHNIIAEYQHGFRKNHSCETQLINTLEEIAKCLDHGKQIDLLVLDFAKAFDTVPHNRLLLKMEQYGIRNLSPPPSSRTGSPDQQQRLLDWFKNWLTNRTQEVMMDGEASDKCQVLSGVPQGTVLGPLCFLIFINDLGDNLSPETRLKLFADDSLLFRVVEDHGDAEMLQKDLGTLLQWTNTWQMKFHPSKCVVMSVTNKKEPIIYDYNIHGESLEFVDDTQYLGVHLHKSLQWENHIDKIVAKANVTLGFVRRNLHQCPEKVKAQAYVTLIRPTLEYASSAWDPYKHNEKMKLEKVQRKAARFATNCKSREEGCVSKSLSKLQWPSLEHRRREARLKTLHRAVNKECAVSIPAYIQRTQERYSTRKGGRNKFIQPFAKRNTYKNSFLPRTISEWNRLPSEITEIKDAKAFGRRINSFFR